MRWLLVLILLGSLPGCRGGPTPSADERAAREVIATLLTNVQASRYDAAWETLHPAHQALVSREQVVACGTRFGPAFDGFTIERASLQDVVPDAVGPTKAWVVTVTFHLLPAFQATTPVDRTFWVVHTESGWHWLLGTGELGVFQQGHCGLPWPGGG